MADRTTRIRGKTLGHFLKGDDKLDENDVANEAYNPGFSKSDDLAHAAVGDERDLRLTPGTDAQDLSVESLRALNSYADSLIDLNENNSPDNPTTSPGSRRGDSIKTSFAAETFLLGADDGADERTDAANSELLLQTVNFTTLAGGIPAAPKLGSFFGQARLNDLISKTAIPGEPSANYLLKENSVKIGKKVDEVLDKTNRFSPDEKEYRETGAGEGKGHTRGLWSEQTGRGTDAGFDPNADDVTSEELREITDFRIAGKDIPLGTLVGRGLSMGNPKIVIHTGGSGKYRPDPGKSVPSGLKRGESLGKVADEHAFVQTNESNDHFDDLSRGAFFDAAQLEGATGDENSRGLLSKVGAPGEPDASDLLKNRSKEIEEQVIKILERDNLYSPGESSPYFNPDAGPAGNRDPRTHDIAGDTDLEKGLWSVQTGQSAQGRGKYEGFDPNAPHMTLGALRGMALKLMLEASGESGVDNLIGIDDSPTEQFLGSLAAMNAAGINITNIAQLGLTPLLYDVTRIRDMIDDPKSSNRNMTRALERLKISTGADQFIEPGKPKRSDYTVNSFTDWADFLSNPNANLNSWAEPFAGGFSMGMFTTSVLGLLSMSLLTALIDVFIDTAKRPEVFGNDGDLKNPSTFKMGRHEGHVAGGALYPFLQLLGFANTTSAINFSTAVYEGMKSFYGFDFDVRDAWNPLYLLKILDKGVSIAMSPGYYAVMQRIILRDVTATLKGFEAAAVSGAGNALGVIAAAAGAEAFRALGTHAIVEVIASSTTFNFMKICVALGDIAYDAQHTPGRVSSAGKVVQYEIRDGKGKVDPNAGGIQKNIHTLTPRLRMQLSRFHPGNNAKPLSPLSLMTHNAILMSHAVKPPIKSVKDVLNVGEMAGFAAPAMAAREKYVNEGLMQPLYTQAPGGGSRFHPHTVKLYEDILDNEFTPFYVHDLRTNELISMPAFITSVGESFSPEWSETHGYGRTDPVRTYSKTTRAIDLTFILAAMNEADMQYMWFVINKLVSMCYPQRSVGQRRTYAQVTGDKGKFVQPFSQVPTASPVVRLRLGELFHSNYSLAGLRRLFGDGTTDFDTKIDGDGDMEYWSKLRKVEVSDENIYYELVAEYEELFKVPVEGGGAEGAQGPGPEVTYEVTDAQLIIKRGKPATGGLLAMVPPLPIPIFATKDPIESEYPRVNYQTAGAGLWFGSGSPKFKVMNFGNVKMGPSADDKWYEVQLYFDDNEQAREILGDPHVLYTLGKDLTTINAWMRINSVEGLRVQTLPVSAVDDRRKQKEEEAVPATKEAYDAAQLASRSFFSAKNAVVRSFQASAGRGLAGVITNMAMNYDNATWGTDQGSRDRAPKMVTITLGFAPIHDLPLGLSAFGELISPSHPVGTGLNKNPHDLTLTPSPS